MTESLPDVNVWVALAAEGHIHHTAANDWFDAQPNASVSFCRVTQMGLLRLLTNPNVMGQSPRTIVQAWEIFTRFQRGQRTFFAGERGDVDSV